MLLLDDFGAYRDDTHGLIAGGVARETYRIHPDDPLSARAGCHWTQTLERESWRIRTEARAEMTADGEHFHLEGSVEAFEDEESIHEKTWRLSIRRDLV